MRLFVAVVPPEPVLARLAAIQERLRSTGADVKWVEPHNLHLTVKFLGEVADPGVLPLREALRKVAGEARTFELRLAGLGSFPPRGAPRVVWVGLADGFPHLEALHEAVEAALEPLGHEREARPFAAHATLGRVRSPRGTDALRREIEAQRDAEVGPMGVRALCLVQSVLTPQGPRYTHVEDFSLPS